MLIVGLGNPGKKYDKNYHNLGFMAIDEYAQKKGVTLKKKKGSALIYEGNINGKKVILAKPQTYMNLSGTSVASLLSSYKVPANKILIIYDDIDLNLHTVRFRAFGSAGTHNGMRSVLKAVGTNNVARIKIGAMTNYKPIKQDLADYVLSNINKAEDLTNTFDKVNELIDEFIQKDGKLENKSIA
jgi:PTH1 family peptidyl-tRNA hydrolase